MKYSSFAFCLMLSALFLAVPNSLRAGEKKIPKKQLPESVLASFKAAYPKSRIKGQSMETEKGKTFYEIESVDGKTRRDLLFTADGKIVEVEEALDLKSISDDMKSAIAREFPKGKVTKAEKVTQDSSAVYEFHVKVGKSTKEITLDGSGKVLKGGKNEGEKEDKDDDEDDD